MRLNKDILFVLGFAGLASCSGYNYVYGTRAAQTMLQQANTQKTVTASQTPDMKSFLMNNPEVIIKSLEEYKVQMMAEQEKQVQFQVEKNMDKIYSENSFVIGNPDAEIKIVEFFDYNCGYCKQVTKIIEQLVDKNENVKVYMKDMPILSENSMESAKAAIAAGFLGKYKEYSSKLMETKEKKTEDTFRKIATEVGLDPNELIEMTHSEKVSNMLMDNRMAASIVGLQGTPTIFIGAEQFKGPFTLEALQEAVRAQLEKAPATTEAPVETM